MTVQELKPTTEIADCQCIKAPCGCGNHEANTIAEIKTAVKDTYQSIKKDSKNETFQKGCLVGVALVLIIYILK